MDPGTVQTTHHLIEQVPVTTTASRPHPEGCTTWLTQHQVHAGNIAQYFSCWKPITNDPVLLEWVIGYHIPEVPTQGIMPKKNVPDAELGNMQEAITNLLELGAVQTCNHSNDQFISIEFWR